MVSTLDDGGGPAFPTDANHDLQGMTMRDYFAGQMLTALFSEFTSNGTEWITETAYEFADAMLKRRNMPREVI